MKSVDTITFKYALARFNKEGFNAALKQELQQLKPSELPLQAALTQSSYLSESKISVVILNVKDNETDVTSKVGVFFFGIIAGSCCADDPTPVDDLQEYCELECNINKKTGTATFALLDD